MFSVTSHTSSCYLLYCVSMPQTLFILRPVFISSLCVSCQVMFICCSQIAQSSYFPPSHLLSIQCQISATNNIDDIPLASQNTSMASFHTFSAMFVSRFHRNICICFILVLRIYLPLNISHNTNGSLHHLCPFIILSLIYICHYFSHRFRQF
jgi:hypothetical protein